MPFKTKAEIIAKVINMATLYSSLILLYYISNIKPCYKILFQKTLTLLKVSDHCYN